MSQFFSPPENIKGNKIFIEGEEAHHLLKVMRLKLGDRVTVFDGKGKIYSGVIIEERKKSAVVSILSKRKLKKLEKPTITLAQGIPARGKMDYLVEKMTELGVDNIIPMETKRSVVKMNRVKAELARSRWEKIAVSASKQCGRIKLPGISRIIKFSQVLKKIPEYDLILFPCLNFQVIPLKKIFQSRNEPQNILVFIGPEGGFSSEEIEQAKSNRCSLITLGFNVLKSDTAALAVLSILLYEYGKEEV